MNKYSLFFLLCGSISLAASRVLPRPTESDNFAGKQYSELRSLSLVVAVVTLPIAVVLILVQAI